MFVVHYQAYAKLLHSSHLLHVTLVGRRAAILGLYMRSHRASVAIDMTIVVAIVAAVVAHAGTRTALGVAGAKSDRHDIAQR